VLEVFQRLHALELAGVGAEDLEEDHPVLLSHVAKYRSLMPSLVLIGHLIDGVDGRTTGPVSRATATRAIAWCEYLHGHARRIYATVTDMARVADAGRPPRSRRHRLGRHLEAEAE
jgi:hypothetical protein